MVEFNRGDIVRHIHGTVDGTVVEFGWDRYIDVVVDWGFGGERVYADELVLVSRPITIDYSAKLREVRDRMVHVVDRRLDAMRHVEICNMLQDAWSKLA